MKNLQLLLDILEKNDSPFVIAEIGQAHDGSLGNALSFIDAVAEAGANAVKFQTHFASEESSNFDSFRVPNFPQDRTRTNYWKRIEFLPEEWQLLSERAEKNNVLFLSSPFSNLAVKVLSDCNVPAWKIASGELENYPMLDQILKTKKPLLISTGLANWAEIEKIVNYTSGRKRALFQCTTAYPSRAEDIGLNNIFLLRQRFKDCVIGLSDHSGEIYPSMSAYMLGARIFEVHVTWSKKMFGPDTSSSLTLSQLHELTRYLNLQKKLIENPVDKDEMRKSKQDLANLFGRGIYAKREIQRGQTIKEADIAYLKPQRGINAKNYKNVINAVAKKTIPVGAAILEGDI